MSAVVPVDFETRERLKQRPDFLSVGLGYRGEFEQAGIVLKIDRLHESRSELSGELSVNSTDRAG